ncbi:hypothetical protein LENED_006210 [Lentinula edodes]|uniref:Uncharacterized protein n=1 Tax=Lentinula edodes TaxID=5353 RepID=A0A1Q3EB95_LENED|nr:hypothetical protein LENED_006210 [Lentinula edodes]
MAGDPRRRSISQSNSALVLSFIVAFPKVVYVSSSLGVYYSHTTPSAYARFYLSLIYSSALYNVPNLGNYASSFPHGAYTSQSKLFGPNTYQSAELLVAQVGSRSIEHISIVHQRPSMQTSSTGPVKFTTDLQQAGNTLP